MKKKNQRVPLGDRTNVNNNRETTEPFKPHQSSLHQAGGSSSHETTSGLLSRMSISGTDVKGGELFSLSKKPGHVPDIDECDENDAQCIIAYVNEVYSTLYHDEQNNLLPETFLNHQPEVTGKMRSILVDWLVEVHRMFKLSSETLFLTAYYTDKFLQNRKIRKVQLQLVGITAMLISSKLEEIYPPECSDFVYISDGAYTKKQILEMECSMLNALEFKLVMPVSLHFLRRFSKAAGSDYTTHNLCKYLLETCLLHLTVHSFPPSLLAAASVYIARRMIYLYYQKLNAKENPYPSDCWNDTLEFYTSYPESTVRQCAVTVNGWLMSFKESDSLKAIEKKYSLQKFGSVSKIPLVHL